MLGGHVACQYPKSAPWAAIGASGYPYTPHHPNAAHGPSPAPYDPSHATTPAHPPPAPPHRVALRSHSARILIALSRFARIFNFLTPTPFFESRARSQGVPFLSLKRGGKSQFFFFLLSIDHPRRPPLPASLPGMRAKNATHAAQWHANAMRMRAQPEPNGY